MSFNHVFKVSVRKKKTKDKGSTQYFRPILWSINRIWEPWGHFILHSLGEFPVATAQKETRKHQCLFCLSCVLLKGIWSHCALSPLSWNSSPKPQWDPPPDLQEHVWKKVRCQASFVLIHDLFITSGYRHREFPLLNLAGLSLSCSSDNRDIF